MRLYYQATGQVNTFSPVVYNFLALLLLSFPYILEESIAGQQHFITWLIVQSVLKFMINIQMCFVRVT